MKSLVALYPRQWRERYGAEFEELLESQHFSLGLVIDVLFGAVDARVRPQAIAEMAGLPGAAQAEGEKTMLSSVMKFRCAGYGPSVTPRDQWIGTAVMLGVTVVLTIVWVALHLRVGDNPYIDSFSLMPFLAGLVLSMPFTYLKGRPAASQAAFLAGCLLLLTVGSVAVGFIAARI